MDHQKIEQALRRGAIMQWEYDLTLYFNAENVDIQIALSDSVNTSASNFVLDIRVHNRLDKPLPCDLKDSALLPHPQVLLKGLQIVDSNDNFVATDPNSPTFSRCSYAMTRPAPSTIPPNGCLLYQIRGIIEGDRIDFGIRKLIFVPGMQHRIWYTHAGIVSNSIQWTAPTFD